jgi:hypothetical protein
MPVTGQQRQQTEARIRAAADRLLRGDLEQRLAQARAAGQVTDPRDAQITRLKQEISELRQRLAGRDAAITELTEFKTRALSRLAAQHDELQLLQAARPGNLRVLPAPSPAPSPSGGSHATA